MRYFGLLILTCLLLPLGSYGQSQNPIQVKHQYFQFADGVSLADCVPGVVMARLKPEFMSFGSGNGIALPGFEKYTDALAVDKIIPAFPFVLPPSETHDALGREMVDLSPIYEIQFPAQTDMEAAVNFLWSSGIFTYVEPLYLYETMYDPADPDTSGQYYLDLVRARDAWDLSKGDSSVVIGIIDTGTSFSHPDLVNKHFVDPNEPIDGIDNDGDGYIDNNQGWDMGGDFWLSPGDNDPNWGGSGAGVDHGVIVSGPAGAENDNNVNIASLGFHCRIMQVKASIDSSPLIYRGYQSIVYAADHGAHILNLAWGGGAFSRFGAEAIQYAIVNKGCLVVASGGNTPGDFGIFPASYPGVFSVMGSEQNDLFWNSSPTFGTTYNYMADLCAPSRDILTIRLNNGNFYATGTSLGAPIVCGIAGLVKSHFPNYTNIQVGERVRVTSDPSIYSLNPGIYTEKMGRGRVDAFEALTAVTPSIRVLDYAFVDPNDGLLQAGDTIELQARFINYLDSTSNVSVSISSPDILNYEILHGNADLGNMGTMDIVSHRLAPFKIRIRPNTPAGYRGHVRIGYTANGYTDYEYLQLSTDPAYVNLEENRINTSFNGTGRWGYMEFPLATGKGLVMDGASGLMGDSGFMIGRSSTELVDNFENQLGTQSLDFTNVNPVYRDLPGIHADAEAHTTFNDNGGGANALGVTVEQNSFQYEFPSDDNYIIQEYQITNNSSTNTLTGLYAGMYFDMDGYWRTNNVSRYDSISRSIYNFTETWVTLWNVAVALLTPDSLHGYAAESNTFGYTKADKWTALSSPPSGAELANTNVVQFASAGPFDIGPGQTHTVAFALVIADSVPHMRSSIQRANEKYNCVIRGNMTPLVDLGPDIHHCNGDTTFLLDASPGYTSYLWDDGSTSQGRLVDSSGTYWVLVTDANGCEDYDQIDITIGDGFEGGFTCSPSQIFVGDLITFSDSTQGVNAWGWNFGDGSTNCPVTPVTTHSYAQPGSYTVAMTISNGVCTDTILKTLSVDTVVGLADPALAAALELFPNPASNQFKMRFSAPVQGSYTVSLRNATGQLVQQLTGEKFYGALEHQFSVAELPSGLYLLEFRMDGLQIGKPLMLGR